jgi:RNA polymerase-binding protein DksA
MAGKLDVEKFKKALQAERRRLERERHLNSLDEAERGSELSDYDNHPADAASETYERTKNFALDENFKEILDRIDEALRKIEDESYGTCDRCGEQIGVERLKAIPYATMCISCQESLERR